MWDILFRGQLGFSISFMEEMWARNMGNLMISPLRPIEFLAALMVMSVVRLAIGVIPATIMAIFFFGFNVYALGFALVAFFCNLIFTSWSVGIMVSGLVLRNGLGAETPCLDGDVRHPADHLRLLSGVALPEWLQVVAWMLPPTYVFEGMRALLADQVFRTDLMLQALAMNVVLLCVSVVIFLALLKSARVSGR